MHWIEFFEGLAAALGTLLTGLWPFLQWMRKRRETREQTIREQAVKDHQAVEAAKNPPATFKDFQELRQETRSHMDEMTSTVENAAHRAQEAGESMKQTAKDMHDQMDRNAKELRETLVIFKMGIDTSLGSVHDKANDAVNKVSALDGRVQALENRKAG